MRFPLKESFYPAVALRDELEQEDSLVIFRFLNFLYKIFI